MGGATKNKADRLRLAFEGWWARYGSDDEEDKDADFYAFSAGWKARSKRSQKQALRSEKGKGTNP